MSTAGKRLIKSAKGKPSKRFSVFAATRKWAFETTSHLAMEAHGAVMARPARYFTLDEASTVSPEAFGALAGDP